MCLSFSSVSPSVFMSEAESQSCDSKPGSCCLCRCDEDPDPEVQVSSAYLLKWICEFFFWQAPVQDSFQRWFITKTQCWFISIISLRKQIMSYFFKGILSFIFNSLWLEQPWGECGCFTFIVYCIIYIIGTLPVCYHSYCDGATGNT